MEKSKIKSYRDLTVWQKSVDCVINLYKVTESFPKQEMFGLTSQLRRAAASIPSNIAEGFRRKTNKEKLQFLRIAYGSGAEIETQLIIANKLGYVNDVNYANLTQNLGEVMKMLNTLIQRFEQKSYSKSVLRTLIFLLLTTYYILPTVSYAADIGLATTKDRFDIEMLAGDKYKGDLVVYNQSADVALPVHIDLALWNIKEDTEDIEFVQAEPTLNATRWFKVEPQDLILDKNASKQIKFEINTPKDVSPGSYLVMMRFRAVLPEHYFEQSGPRFLPELGVLFFINVRSLILEGDNHGNLAKILSFDPVDTHRLSFIDRFFVHSANAGFFDEAVKKLVTKVENQGIYYFKASGFITIKNYFGQTVALVKFPEKYLLPNRVRAISVDVATPPPDNIKSNFFSSMINMVKQNAYFGPYTATIVLNVPSERGAVTPVSASMGFWIIPWKFWLSIIAMLAILWIIIFKVRKRIKPALLTLMGR